MKVRDLGRKGPSPINLKEYVKLDINTSNYGSRWELFDIINPKFHQSLSNNDTLTNMKYLFDNTKDPVNILDIAGRSSFVIDLKNKYILEGFIFYICPRGSLSIDIYGSNDKTNYIKIDSSSNFINGLSYGINTFLELYFDNNKIKYRYYKLVFGDYFQGIWISEIYTYVQRPNYYCFKNNSKLFNINKNNNEVNCDINNKTNMSDSLNQLNIIKASEKYSEIEIVKV